MLVNADTTRLLNNIEIILELHFLVAKDGLEWDQNKKIMMKIDTIQLGTMGNLKQSKAKCKTAFTRTRRRLLMLI